MSPANVRIEATAYASFI
jgi:hypothetical protein